MIQSLLSQFGESHTRVENAIAALQQGQGVLVVDDENRENEGDFVFSAEHFTTQQMAEMIREGSGIVCLCMGDERVTTGVSAADRVTTIKAATADNAKPSDLSRPGHVFGLKAQTGGVLVRRGHTEASVDLMQLAGLKPFGVICELTNPDGTMARLPQVSDYANKHSMTVVTIEDLVQYIQMQELKVS